MIRLLRAAVRGIRSEYAVPLDEAQPRSTQGRVYSSHAGKTVGGNSALNISAAFDCTRKTSQIVAGLPLKQKERAGSADAVNVDDALSEILTVSPNSDQTAFEFWQGMIAQMVLRGNAYAERVNMGSRLVALEPLFNVTPSRKANGALEYSFTDRGKREVLPASKVFHLRGFGGGDGVGMSAIAYGANSLGSALAADETAGSIFSNGMTPGGLLEVDQQLNEEQRGQLEKIMSNYVGSTRAGKMMILEKGMKVTELQMNPEDAQLLETRRFNVEDVCRWFGVPPIIIGHASDGQTMWGSGVEAIMLSWRTLGINPLLRSIEGRIRKDLIAAPMRGRRFFEFNREAMLQMDSKAKAEFLSKMATSATMTANERREKLGLPRHESAAADRLLAQGAMVPIELLGEKQT